MAGLDSETRASFKKDEKSKGKTLLKEYEYTLTTLFAKQNVLHFVRNVSYTPRVFTHALRALYTCSSMLELDINICKVNMMYTSFVMSFHTHVGMSNL